MQINATVVSVENNVDIAKKDGGSYKGSRLTYRDAAGKLTEQAFHENVLKYGPSIKAALLAAKPGDAVIIDKIKGDDGYWKIQSIIKNGTGTLPVTEEGAKVTPVNSPKSTYETAEERAKKQVYIVRQSSITAALTFLGTKAKSVAEVVSVAKQFENYVFSNDAEAVVTEAPDTFPGDEKEVF